MENALILEYKASEHYLLRKNERVDNVAEIILPDDFYAADEDKTVVNETLIKAIRLAVNKRLAPFTHEVDIERDKYNITIVATVLLLRNGKTYTPILKAVSTTTKNGEEEQRDSVGNSYVAYTKDEMLITLLLLPDDQISKEFLVRKMIYNRKKEGIILNPDNVSFHLGPNSLIRMSADHILKPQPTERPQGEPKTPEDLPYKVRGDYRNSTSKQESYFTHKDFGKGKIIASDEGMSSTGIWDSITVKFPGDPTPKIFKRIYTTTFFRSKGIQEEFAKAEKLLGLSLLPV